MLLRPNFGVKHFSTGGWRHSRGKHYLRSLVSTAWERPPRIDVGLRPPELRRFCAGEAETAFLALADALRGAYWVNPAETYGFGGIKPVQLSIAAEQGFRVPRSLITTSASDANKFLASLGGRGVYKTLTNPVLYPLDTQVGAMVYASEVTLRDLEAVQGLLATPILLQERIDVRYEARVTVVGRAIFTAFVRTPQDAPIDWRRGLGTYSEFSQGELPNVVAARLLAVMDRLGLVYGAVDLALSSSGDYVFFEINPSGAYGWIEDELDYNISSSLARILLRCPSTSHR